MKKEQIKVMISKVKNKIWLFLKKIYAKLPEKMKVHIRKLKPKEKIKGEYRGSDRAEEMPVLKVSPNRNWIRLFWVLLVISIILGIYNNFTSVDTVTVEKETVIEEKLKDTNALESYVKGFAGVYHAWENTDREISKREKTLEKYLPETLQAYGSWDDNDRLSDCGRSRICRYLVCERSYGYRVRSNVLCKAADIGR